MDVRMASGWQELLAPEFRKPYFDTLAAFVRAEYTDAKEGRGPRIFPEARNIFRAFDECRLDELKVVIIGQDPYPGYGQANGLCFSVNPGVPLPRSLRNIFTEIHNDLGTPCPADGDLDRWARQGVLLLNSVLTVREGQPGSNAGHGWETFTDAVVEAIDETRRGVVYMLWGAYAQKKGRIVDETRNCVLKAAHPSPLSVTGFFGCRHFSKANAYLESEGKTPIKW